ncbi:MAG TPA: GNAT family N-acetyltransferase [Anaerolineae bacterium]|nr:GNAT family N-acetyltransferase [Anaerolineae bacterium]HQI83278.1 GNAT family N-acetyltransferase [Anaerolineae bacterium]
MTFAIRSYRGTDEAALLDLWRATMTHDPITPSVWRTKVLLDPNFDPEGLLVAEDGEALVGFVLSLVRRVPYFLQGLEPEVGWITAFGVHPERRRQGIGRALFDAALARMAALGRTRVAISPYTPNYFIPGVDVDAYPAAVAFLSATGWQTTSIPIAMRAELTGLQIPPDIIALEDRLRQDDIVMRPVQPADLPALMAFTVEHFGWDWYRFAQDYLLALFGAGADDIGCYVAARGDAIVGYCQHRRERFGPFGVAPEMRNRGIGRLLLFRCLADMAARGFHCAYFLWTGKDAARMYSLAGFRQMRQFAIMQKTLFSSAD